MRNIEKAKKEGYEVEIHYIGVNSAKIAKDRIKHRVAMGGHDIPDEDVNRRFSESFENLRLILCECDRVVLYDNTMALNRFAVYEQGKRISLAEIIPEWYIKYVDY